MQEGKWVILASHHGLGYLGDGSMAAKEAHAEAVPSAELVTLFGNYGNIIASITGHSHEHVVNWIETAAGQGFWEIQTASLLEFPNQLRMIEVRDAGDGYAVIDLTCIDLCTDGDVVAEEGRKLALVDHATGWDRGKAGRLVDRNVRLFVKPTV